MLEDFSRSAEAGSALIKRWTSTLDDSKKHLERASVARDILSELPSQEDAIHFHPKEIKNFTREFLSYIEPVDDTLKAFLLDKFIQGFSPPSHGYLMDTVKGSEQTPNNIALQLNKAIDELCGPGVPFRSHLSANLLAAREGKALKTTPRLTTQMAESLEKSLGIESEKLKALALNKTHCLIEAMPELEYIGGNAGNDMLKKPIKMKKMKGIINYFVHSSTCESDTHEGTVLRRVIELETLLIMHRRSKYKKARELAIWQHAGPRLRRRMEYNLRNDSTYPADTPVEHPTFLDCKLGNAYSRLGKLADDPRKKQTYLDCSFDAYEDALEEIPVGPRRREILHSLPLHTQLAPESYAVLAEALASVPKEDMRYSADFTIAGLSFALQQDHVPAESFDLILRTFVRIPPELRELRLSTAPVLASALTKLRPEEMTAQRCNPLIQALAEITDRGVREQTAFKLIDVLPKLSHNEIHKLCHAFFFDEVKNADSQKHDEASKLLTNVLSSSLAGIQPADFTKRVQHLQNSTQAREMHDEAVNMLSLYLRMSPLEEITRPLRNALLRSYDALLEECSKMKKNGAQQLSALSHLAAILPRLEPEEIIRDRYYGIKKMIMNMDASKGFYANISEDHLEAQFKSCYNFSIKDMEDHYKDT